MCVYGAAEHPYHTLYHSIHLGCLSRTEICKDRFCIITIVTAAATTIAAACWCEMTFNAGSSFTQPAGCDKLTVHVDPHLRNQFTTATEEYSDGK